MNNQNLIIINRLGFLAAENARLNNYCEYFWSVWLVLNKVCLGYKTEAMSLYVAVNNILKQFLASWYLLWVDILSMY